MGSDWMAVSQACPDHCGVLEFQNLRTGAVDETDPSTSTRGLDLNDPALTRSLCPGVTAQTLPTPSGQLPPPLPRATVTMDRSFAIIGTYGGSWLERCGTRLHEFLTFSGSTGVISRPCANGGEIVWQSAPGRLTGLFLPSRRRFTIKVPLSVDPDQAGAQFVQQDPYGLALTPRTLYVSTGAGVWTAPAPRGS